MSEKITPASTGTFTIRTAAGTELLLELTGEGDSLTRRPGMNHPQGHSEPSRLLGDFTPLPLVVRPTLTVGEPGQFEVIAGRAPEIRVSAPITEISPA